MPTKKKPTKQEIDEQKAEKKEARIEKARQAFDLSSRTILLSEMEEIGRIPTSIAPFDVTTGGGIPLGTITLITGPPSAGKSTMAAVMMGGFSRLYPDKYIVYISAENKLEAYWVRVHGGEGQRIHVKFPENTEQAQYVTREIALRRPDVGMIVVDSLAALCPEIELDPENYNILNQQMGIAAKLNNGFMRQLTAIQLDRYNSKNPLTVIIINQERASMEMYKPAVIPGGNGQRFHNATWVHMLTAEDKIGTKSKIPISTTLRWRLDKNFGGAKAWAGEVEMYVTPVNGHLPGYFHDQAFTWLWMQQRFGLIKSHGSSGYEYKGEMHSREQWLHYWESNDEAYRAVKEELVATFKAWNRGEHDINLKEETESEAKVA